MWELRGFPDKLDIDLPAENQYTWDITKDGERSHMEHTIWIYTGYAAGVLLLAAMAAVCVFALRRLRRGKHTEMDDMEGREFEYYCAGLLEQSGFTEVEVTRGSGDFGVDILAEKDGITYAVQCKCYNAPIGIKAVQEVYAGRDYYDRMVGAVMTNQYFTPAAVKAAGKLKILLWDRGYVESLLEEGE